MNPDTHLIPAQAQLATLDLDSVFKAAIENKSAVDVMERLMAIRREINTENAKTAFNAAMQTFQHDCGPIKKLKKGARDNIKYAPLEAIIDAVKELLHAHGLSFRFDSEPEPGWVTAICEVTHTFGHSQTSRFKVPIDQKNGMMNAPQQYAGALTFAQRRAFQNAFGIVTEGEDMDGRQPKERHGEAQVVTKPTAPQKTPEQIIEGLKERLWTRAKPHFNAKHETFKKWLIENRHIEPSDDLSKLPASKLEKLCEIVEEVFDAQF